MDIGLFTYGLALAAGALSTLAPCVLPLIPILIASALMAHRLGPLALAAGLALAYATVGMLLASVGSVAGLDQTQLRGLGAAILILFGVLLIVPRLQTRFAALTAGLGDSAQARLGRLSPRGLTGQFLVGLLLGAVWSPCVGPVLGGAIALAGQGDDVIRAALVMGLFGLGAAAPLILLGTLSREAMQRVRGHLLSAGQFGKPLLGALFLLLGVLVASGADKSIEAWLLGRMPGWLTDLGTSL